MFTFAAKGLGFPIPAYLQSPFREVSRLSSTMAATDANSRNDDSQTRSQQSPLASQRAKQEGKTAENGRAAKSGGFFTLGYKEGFNQWVGMRRSTECEILESAD